MNDSDLVMAAPPCSRLRMGELLKDLTEYAANAENKADTAKDDYQIKTCKNNARHDGLRNRLDCLGMAGCFNTSSCRLPYFLSLCYVNTLIPADSFFTSSFL